MTTACAFFINETTPSSPWLHLSSSGLCLQSRGFWEMSGGILLPGDAGCRLDSALSPCGLQSRDRGSRTVMPFRLGCRLPRGEGVHDFVGPPVCGCWVAWLKLNTPTLCSDYNNIKAAYEAMKNVACLINERKRKLESIDKIARWQVSIVGWEVRGSPPPP